MDSEVVINMNMGILKLALNTSSAGDKVEIIKFIADTLKAESKEELIEYLKGRK